MFMYSKYHKFYDFAIKNWTKYKKCGTKRVLLIKIMFNF